MNKQVTVKSLWLSIAITLATGLVFYFFAEQVNNFIGYIVGFGLILIGVFTIISYFKTSTTNNFVSLSFAVGTILTLAGLFFVINPTSILGMLTLFFSFYIIINGIISLQMALNAYRNKFPRWYVPAILGTINIVLGSIIFYNPFGATNSLIRWIGIFMIVSSILNMISIFVHKKTIIK